MIANTSTPDLAVLDGAQWDAEYGFLGVLLGQSVSVASTFTEIVPDTAITDPMNRWVYELQLDLVADGRDPHPVALLHRARTTPARRALRPDAPPTERDLARLGIRLASLFGDAPPGDALARAAHAVLEGAYQAAYRAAVMRMHDLVETRTDPEELRAALSGACTTLVDLRHRAARCAELTSRAVVDPKPLAPGA